jgi:hypothetical protein
LVNFRVQADPWNTDTDGDGWSDGHEINNGMLPTNWAVRDFARDQLVPGSGLRMASMVTTNSLTGSNIHESAAGGELDRVAGLDVQRRERTVG